MSLSKLSPVRLPFWLAALEMYLVLFVLSAPYFVLDSAMATPYLEQSSLLQGIDVLLFFPWSCSWRPFLACTLRIILITFC